METKETWLRECEGGVLVCTQVQAGAKSTQATGVLNKRLKIKIKAAPVEGTANEELIKWPAKTVGIPKTYILLTAGVRSKIKSVKLQGVRSEHVKQCLLRNL